MTFLRSTKLSRAVDGSVFDTVAKVAELSWVPMKDGKRKHAYRLHTQFEILRGVPNRIDVTSANPKGEDDERAVLQRTLESDRCYVIDRGYAKFALFNAIVSKQSSYVCRVRDNSSYQVVEQRELNQADREEGVLSDEIVSLATGRKAEDRPDHAVRFVIVEATPHTSRGKYRGGSTGHSSDGKLRIATNLLDVPAELISKIYRLRWMIELFFRMFKGLLGCSHLLSTKQNGVEIQAYLAIYRLSVDPHLYRQDADQTDLRNDLLLSARLGRTRRARISHRPPQSKPRIQKTIAILPARLLSLSETFTLRRSKIQPSRNPPKPSHSAPC